MKKLLKKLIPKKIISSYHYILAKAANFYYGRPSEKLIVIGVTGTNGKTTTCRLIAEILKEAGYKVGLTSTAEFQIGDRRWLNDQKMTMMGRAALQRLLRQMAAKGCRYAIIETSSEGIKQFRHIGINYDVAIFTNLTPEHIESHGGFKNYKSAKGELFKHLTRQPKKHINGKEIDKISIVNLDDEYSSFFLQFPADKKYGFTAKTKYDITGVRELRFNNIRLSAQGSNFNLDDNIFSLSLLGEHNVYNAAAAITAGLSLGVGIEIIKNALKKIKGVPGRLELIEAGQPFKVLIDYAPEPVGLRKLYETILLFDKKNVIHVLGSCGGGRDKSRRPILGKIAAKNASFVIVTNEDPYDEDPQEIINQVAAGAAKAGKTENVNLFKILDRRDAIKKALNLAKINDIVLITGKGCEQAIVVAGNIKIPWDYRKVATEELKKIQNSPPEADQRFD